MNLEGLSSGSCSNLSRACAAHRLAGSRLCRFCRVCSKRRHAQEQSRKRPAHHSGQHLLVSRLATYAPLVAVFLLALLMGFAGRVLLPQQQQSIPVAGMMSSVLSQASAASQPAVHRRRLIALSSPFRVNPLAGQVKRWAAQFMSVEINLQVPCLRLSVALMVGMCCVMPRCMATYSEFAEVHLSRRFRQDSDAVECPTQVPKLKPGSGPKSRRSSGGALGAEDEDALVLDPDMMAPHALGAPAARLPKQALQALPQKPQLEAREDRADWAVAAESAPQQLASLGRRLAPGSAPGPAGRVQGLERLGCSEPISYPYPSCSSTEPICLPHPSLLGSITTVHDFSRLYGVEPHEGCFWVNLVS